MITITIHLNGNPLRRTYVSHFDLLRVPHTLFFRTNDLGQVTISNAGVTFGDPNGPAGATDITVHAQNVVARVLDANLGVEVSQRFTVSNGSIINITTTAQQRDHFRILDQCLDAYETVFRQFAPFNRVERGPFPFGTRPTTWEMRTMVPRIEVRFPENNILAPGESWTEPFSASTGYPLMHIKATRADGSPQDEIFGTNGQQATLIPHELAHALHFALLPDAMRPAVEARYGAFIADRLANGQSAFHGTTMSTDPFVAFIEALGLFSERFFLFAKQVRPGISGQGWRQAFFRDELGASPALRSLQDDYVQVGRLSSGRIVPTRGITGDRVEGAVYGALFLDFARRRGLREAVGRYLESRALEFRDFRNFIVGQTDFDSDILASFNASRTT